MTEIDVPDGMALACRTCAWRPADDVPMGVIAAHFETEHDGAPIVLDLIVVCPRCDKAMAHERSIGQRDVFTCEPCHRTRTLRRAEATP